MAYKKDDTPYHHSLLSNNKCNILTVKDRKYIPSFNSLFLRTDGILKKRIIQYIGISILTQIM